MVFFFFFSSRRRHTILVSDWSSDVCSSDLLDALERLLARLLLQRIGARLLHRIGGAGGFDPPEYVLYLLRGQRRARPRHKRFRRLQRSAGAVAARVISRRHHAVGWSRRSPLA